MLEKGKKVGEYVLLEKLGAGGFGDVWKAEKRTALDANHFALKFFRPKQDGVDFDKIGKELAVWKRLRGLPHIISVIELDRFEDYVYVVSDFADGGSLETLLKNNGGKAQTETEAVRIALEILTGLENLHGKNFVHRDLKPDNILIMNGRHCLADFGISREIKTHSKATGTAGTMEYMPPEAFEKTPSVTPQTDIWAVGAILQRLLTGNLPYPQDDQPSLIAAILMSEPDEMPETVSQSLREIVKKSLQKNRENRFQSAGEMHEALKNPQKFLESQIFSQTETLILEDLDKTEEYNIAPTKDWREIEAEKQRQPEEQQRLEKEKLQSEAEAKRFQSEKEESGKREAEEAKRREEIRLHNIEVERLRKQKEAEDLQEEKRRREPEARWRKQRNFGFGIVGGMIGLFLLIFLMNRNPAVTISNSASNTADKPANAASNKTNSANNAANMANVSTGETFKNSIGMEFVRIPAGSFMMGSPTSETGSSDDERPQHRVTISKDFYLGKYEVTQGKWKAVMGNNPSSFSNCGDNCPVENVSWEDAQEFIKRLNGKGEGTYRLPTEAEWEYACRAGTTGAYSGNLDEMGWYDKNSGSKTHPVGQKKANAFGLYDMHGNVWEWTADWYGNYSGGSVTNPIGASSGSSRVFRGSSWSSEAVSLRSAIRNGGSPSFRYNNLGFRVVRQ